MDQSQDRVGSCAIIQHLYRPIVTKAKSWGVEPIFDGYHIILKELAGCIHNLEQSIQPFTFLS